MTRAAAAGDKALDETWAHQALAMANINALRLALYQATGEEELAAIPVVKEPYWAGAYQMACVAPDHAGKVRQKALDYLRSERRDACPLPVVKAKRAISELKGAGQVEILVDNEIAVQNLTKMAQQKGYQYSAEKLAEREYRVLFTIGEAPAAEETPAVCMPDARTDTVVAIGANTMGAGAEELGKTLLKAFVFALTQQDKLPKTVLFYNGGASLTCEGSPMLEDLKTLESEGVEIMTCGTCLNYYGLTEKLAVGSVTNMYAIVEKLTHAGNVVKP